MTVTISIIVSVLALLATLYQLHLQRVHNQKSVKPFAQITLADQNNILAVHLYNNGLGPLIVTQFIFTKDGVEHFDIASCLALDPKTFMHVSVNDAVQRVILPDSRLTVFEKKLANSGEEEMNTIRRQLASIKLQVRFRDIYDQPFATERSFDWFTRHFQAAALES